MKNVILILLLLLIFLGAAGGVYYFLLMKRGGVVTLPSLTSVIGNKVYSTEQLKATIKSGVSLKCTYKDDEQNYGTSYLKGMKIYSDMVLNGKTVKVVMKDKCMWNWNEAMQGSKMCFDASFEEMLDYDYSKELKDLQAKAGTYPTKPVRQYSCSGASVADSMFQLPANVSFIDMDQMQKQQEEMMNKYQQEDSSLNQPAEEEIIPEETDE